MSNKTQIKQQLRLISLREINHDSNKKTMYEHGFFVFDLQ